MAVELGHWHQKKSKTQDITDMAALAAAYEVMSLKEKANYQTAAEGDAYENGLDFNLANLVVNHPPSSGEYAGKNGVEVILNKEQPLFFSSMFGVENINMETRATALLLNGIPACVLALSPSAGPAVEVTGNATVDVNGCSIHTNSTATNSIQVGDKNTLRADCLSSVGGIIPGSGTQLSDCPAPDEYTYSITDPYADVTLPTDLASRGCLDPKKYKIKWDYYLPAGRYCTNIKASGAVYLMDMDAEYIFDGADLNIGSQYALLQGREVTLIFANGGVFGTGNGGMLDVTPRKTGPFAGITIYYDPVTTPQGTSIKINGNSGSSIEGVIYAPTADITYNGGSTGNSECLQIIANTVEFSGNASLTNQNCESTGTRRIGGQSGVALVQ